MKKISIIAIVFFSASLFTACMSSDQKKEAADAQVVIAQDNLDKVQDNANAVAAKAADVKLKVMISDAHETFHKIAGECKKTD